MAVTRHANTHGSSNANSGYDRMHNGDRQVTGNNTDSDRYGTSSDAWYRYQQMQAANKKKADAAAAAAAAPAATTPAATTPSVTAPAASGVYSPTSTGDPVKDAIIGASGPNVSNNTTLSADENRKRTYASVQQQFRDAGLDPAAYDQRILNALDLQQSAFVPGGTTTFSNDTGKNVLADVRKQKVRDYNNAVNAYAPEGFETGAFADTADDNIINSILGSQYDDATAAITRARDRGTLNDVGYKYAMDNLGTTKSAANARLQSLGGGVLSGYRTQLGDIAKNARTGASSWDFGDTYDPNTYKTSIENKKASLGGLLEGDVRNAVGGEQFFDWNALIQKGGIGQGSTNTGLGSMDDGTLLGAISQRKKDEETTRGLGTQGAF